MRKHRRMPLRQRRRRRRPQLRPLQLRQPASEVKGRSQPLGRRRRSFSSWRRVLAVILHRGGSYRPSSFSRWYYRSTAPQQNAPKRSEPLPLSALRFEAQTLSCGARPVHGRSCCASPKASPVEPEWFTRSALLSSAVHTLCAAESRRPLGLSTLHNPPEHLPPPDVHFLALR
jgi:hypothetical protein